MRNENQNNLFILVVGIEFGRNCITIDVFTLFLNRNRLLQVTKLTVIYYGQ